MDVLIKNMKMPKNCGCCDLCLLSSDNLNFFCTRQIGKRFAVSLAEQRQEGCPLVELPPHGELKDADFIISCLEEIKDRYPNTYKIVKGILDRTPTVLEASE